MNSHRPLPFLRRPLLAAATIAIAAAPLHAAEPPGLPDGWSQGYVYANGSRLNYYHAVPAPEKPPIVMVHGVTDNGLHWATLTLKLQDDYDIYMLDARGHGLSDPFRASDDGDTMVKDVVETIKVLGIKNPILMGHSMGGATVIRVGAEYPDLARGVITLDAGLPRVRPRPESDRGEARREERGEGAGRDRQGGPPPRAPQNRDTEPDRLSISMFGSPETLVAQNNYDFDDIVATGVRQNPKWGLLDVQYWALSKKQYHGAYSNETFREVMQGGMRTADSLSKIPVPVLILKADASPEAREAQQESISEMPRVKLVHIDGGGHNLHHDELEQTAEVLTEYLPTLVENQDEK